jgi:hypothetical protein
VFGFFAVEYGLKEIAIGLDSDRRETPGWSHLIEAAVSRGVTTILAEPRDADTANVIADAIGAEVITVQALSDDYMATMWDLALKVQSTGTRRPASE